MDARWNLIGHYIILLLICDRRRNAWLNLEHIQCMYDFWYGGADERWGQLWSGGGRGRIIGGNERRSSVALNASDSDIFVHMNKNNITVWHYTHNDCKRFSYAEFFLICPVIVPFEGPPKVAYFSFHLIYFFFFLFFFIHLDSFSTKELLYFCERCRHSPVPVNQPSQPTWLCDTSSC